jgi:cytochrome c peroxidase
MQQVILVWPEQGLSGAVAGRKLVPMRVNVMVEFQATLRFPPAPKLDVLGKLDPGRATPAELRGQEIFFGKGQCGICHALHR